MSEKEVRLVRIIQRLETKIKTFWDENNALKQKLELSVLDREISEENARSLEAQLQQANDDKATLQTKIEELNELNELNIELEKSYAAEKMQLESEITRLKADLASFQLNTQQLEALNIELKTSERKLKAAQFDLKMLRQGFTATLQPLLEDNVDWLQIIEHFKLNVESHLTSYKLGDINSSRLQELLEETVVNYRGNPDQESVITLLTSISSVPLHLKAILSYSPDYMQIIDRIEHKQPFDDLLKTLNGSQEELAATKCPPDGNESGHNSLQMRIEILESKLEKAQGVANELDKLQVWQTEALTKEMQYHEQISELNARLQNKESEIARLTKAALPADLLKANENHQVTELKATVSFLTRNPKDADLTLDPLPLTPTVPISRLAGHKRITKLRKAAFELAPIDQASICAIDQDVQLKFI